MNEYQRLGLAARALFVATALGLILAIQRDDRSVFIAVSLIAGLALLVMFAAHLWPHLHWLLIAEGGAAAVVVGHGLPNTGVLLPYLLVPAILAGIQWGASTATTVAGLQIMCLVGAAALPSSELVVIDAIEFVSPWAVASLGAGLVAAWFNQLRMFRLNEENSYTSARRLLSELRTVTRRLSSGLDTSGIASAILAGLHDDLEDSRSALFVRNDSGLFEPLAYRGLGARQALIAEGHLVEECRDSAMPVQEHRPSGTASTRHRVLLPLRSGGRFIGLVMSDGSHTVPATLFEELLQGLDEKSLRLDTALVFDEVRAMGTVEERQRLAREIHDGVAQEVASLGYLVDDLLAEADSSSQSQRLKVLRSEVTRVVHELRLSIFDLRSEVSATVGLGSALSDYVRTVGARSDLTVHLTLDEAPNRLRNDVETEMLRIAQEAVTNARKHSAAENLWVHCRVRPPFARITIEDDGEGLGESRHDSYGLTIMRERAERIGACFELGGADKQGCGGGTRVVVTVGETIAPDADAKG